MATGTTTRTDITMPKLRWDDRTVYEGNDVKAAPVKEMRAEFGTDHAIVISRESGEWCFECPPFFASMPLMLPAVADPEKAQERAVSLLREKLIELLSWLK